ncbi:MAG: hypothetical protein PXY39_03065 [archaeon]|nr:hypothetical protein [archaeon]
MTHPKSRSPSTSQTLSTKDLRMRVYSCEFCELIQTGLSTQVEGNASALDPASEAKYLYHLRTIHGLEK